MAAWPAAAVAVVASRANPPERRREESDNYSGIFRIKIIKVNYCHTASPATTGKLTENETIIITKLFVGGRKYIFSNEKKHSDCLLMFII